MPVFKQPKAIHFTADNPVEKHFHDFDETWVITGGKCNAYMVDREGKREEFVLAAGDIWILLDLEETPRPDDAADGLAIAITHYQYHHFESLTG